MDWWDRQTYVCNCCVYVSGLPRGTALGRFGRFLSSELTSWLSRSTIAATSARSSRPPNRAFANAGQIAARQVEAKLSDRHWFPSSLPFQQFQTLCKLSFLQSSLRIFLSLAVFVIYRRSPTRVFRVWMEFTLVQPHDLPTRPRHESTNNLSVAILGGEPKTPQRLSRHVLENVFLLV